jgi:electron transfer flavoprotein beta subunit
MIKILVCFKQVAYLYSRMGIDSSGKIDPDGIVYVPNPHDEVALEEALRIKESVNQTEVFLISLGPPRVEKALEYGLAMGANQAIHVFEENSGMIDPYIISKAFAKVIETQEFDLILCGKNAIDDNMGITGGFMAEWLNLPYVSSVTEISLVPEGKKARMYQVLERGNRQLIECDLPVLLSVEKWLITPRYPTLMGRLAASKKKIFKVDLRELGIISVPRVGSEMEVSKLSVMRPKPKKMFTPDSNLPIEERLKLIMSGGIVEKKSSSLKGLPHELAEQFINFLNENLIIRKRSGSRGRASGDKL